MPLEISRNDITNIVVDAIVNPTDRFLSGSGSIDKTIHKMAGSKLDKELETAILESGKALITDSYNFKNCRYIIHTCGPIYKDGKHDEEEILRSCYLESLNLARYYNLESIAFPLIASGSFMFPKGKALKIASDTITEFLLDNEMKVYLLVYDKDAFDTANKLYTDIKDYLIDNFKEKKKRKPKPSLISNVFKDLMFAEEDEDCSYSSVEITEEKSNKKDLHSRFEPDESFSECLIRMIDERGLLDPDVYKRANIDRKHFNHIKNDKYYRPKKETARALAIGLNLNLDDTNTLLERAGFVLSNSSKFDLIIKYCIENSIYNIFDINEILFEEDQKTLGC